MVPVAFGVLLYALLATGTTEVPVAERRPVDGVGEIHTGDTQPVVYERACPMLEGIQIAGGPADLDSLRRGLAALCNARPEGVLWDRLATFSHQGGVVRFAVFERSGASVTSDLEADPPMVYLNARYSRTDPSWLGPLLVYETAFLHTDPRDAVGVFQARQAEAQVCEIMLPADRPSPGCRDAEALLGLPDPVAALREAGFR